MVTYSLSKQNRPTSIIINIDIPEVIDDYVIDNGLDEINEIYLENIFNLITNKDEINKDKLIGDLNTQLLFYIYRLMLDKIKELNLYITDLNQYVVENVKRNNLTLLHIDEFHRRLKDELSTYT